MPTITIGTNDYDAYADVATADAYLAAEPLHAARWAALATDAKGQALIAASRAFDRFPNWTDGAVPNPQPQAVIDAVIIYAAEIAAKPALSQDGAPGSTIKALGAGPARVEYFAPQTAAGFSTAILRLLSPYIGGGKLTGKATGTSGTTAIADYSRGGFA